MALFHGPHVPLSWQNLEAGLLINNSIAAGFVLARELLLLLICKPICRLRSKVGTFVPRAMCSGRNYEQLAH